MCAAALALFAFFAGDPAPKAPIRAEQERCAATGVPSPTVLRGARIGADGRRTLRPAVAWAKPPKPSRPVFRLLDPAQDALLDAAGERLRWVATDAGTVGSAGGLVPGRAEAPAVRTDLGVRTELSFGVVRMFAEGMARLDAKGTTDAATASMRLSPRARVQLEARPHARVHLGVELCHRGARGLDALPRYTQGLARVRFGF
ncbi:MAG: hypothetical protein ACE37F_17820 [Nannocystaceae bacterium]|nr:hypothetical protein [bacterium]